MKEKIESFELKLYEKLGVKFFKKFVLKLHKAVFGRKDPDYEKTSSNYRIGKIEYADDLQNHKHELRFNAIVHIVGLMAGLTSLITTILSSAGLPAFILPVFLILLNSYCIMLQRYNYIRIDRAYKKYKKHDDKLKEVLVDDLRKTQEFTKDLNHELKTKKKTDVLSFEEFLAKASLKELKKYKDDLYFQELILRRKDEGYPIYFDRRELKLTKKQQ